MFKVSTLFTHLIVNIVLTVMEQESASKQKTVCFFMANFISTTKLVGAGIKRRVYSADAGNLNDCHYIVCFW
jgi:ABC-type polysaccharide transport system permease subunit